MARADLHIPPWRRGRTGVRDSRAGAPKTGPERQRAQKGSHDTRARDHGPREHLARGGPETVGPRRKGHDGRCDQGGDARDDRRGRVARVRGPWGNGPRYRTIHMDVERAARPGWGLRAATRRPRAHRGSRTATAPRSTAGHTIDSVLFAGKRVERTSAGVNPSQESSRSSASSEPRICSASPSRPRGALRTWS